MSTLYANDFGPGIPLGSGLVPGSPSQGALNANLLTGGFLSVPTIADRDAIPVDLAEGLKLDGLSSGRRQAGMVVTIAETGERFELKIPAFTTLSDADKLTALADNANWVEFAAGSLSFEDWDATKVYAYGDLVTNDEVLWRCVGPYDPTQFAIEPLRDAFQFSWQPLIGVASALTKATPSISGNVLTISTNKGDNSVTLPAADVDKAYVDAANASLQAAITTEKNRMDTLVANAPQALDTLEEIAAQLASDEQGTAAILATQQQHTQQIGGKADKTYVDGADTNLQNQITTLRNSAFDPAQYSLLSFRGELVANLITQSGVKIVFAKTNTNTLLTTADNVEFRQSDGYSTHGMFYTFRLSPAVTTSITMQVLQPNAAAYQFFTVAPGEIMSLAILSDAGRSGSVSTWKWVKVYTSKLPTIDVTKAYVDAQLAGVAHLSGDETFVGNKTFTRPVIVNTAGGNGLNVTVNGGTGNVAVAQFLSPNSTDNIFFAIGKQLSGSALFGYSVTGTPHAFFTTYGRPETDFTISGTTGYVGIGTNTPKAPLDVDGYIHTSKQIWFEAATPGYFGNFEQPGGNLIGFSRPNQQLFTIDLQSGNSYFPFGNLGVGTTTPSEKIEVVGNIKASTLLGNRLGVGTSTPDYPVVIVGDTDSIARGPLVVRADNSTGVGAAFTLDSTGSGGKLYSFVSGGTSSGVGAGNFGFFNGTDNRYVFQVNANGDVKGFGTFNIPQARLAGAVGSNPAMITTGDAVLGAGASLFFKGDYNYSNTFLGYKNGSGDLVLSVNGVLTTFKPDGSVVANKFVGDGSQLTNLPSATVNTSNLAKLNQANTFTASNTVTDGAGSSVEVDPGLIAIYAGGDGMTIQSSSLSFSSQGSFCAGISAQGTQSRQDSTIWLDAYHVKVPFTPVDANDVATKAYVDQAVTAATGGSGGGGTTKQTPTYDIAQPGQQYLYLPEDADGILDLLVLEPGGGVRPIYQADYTLAGSELFIGADANLVPGDQVRGSYYLNGGSSAQEGVATISAVSSPSYTLTLTDAGSIVTFDQAATCVIPLNSDLAFAVGTIIEIAQEGTGQVTIGVADPSITLRYFGGVKTAGQWASLSLRQRSIDEWVITNGVA